MGRFPTAAAGSLSAAAPSKGPSHCAHGSRTARRGANPEELIGLGNAACYTMSLADLLSTEGHPPEDLQTDARVHLEQTDTGWSITLIELHTTGKVDGIDAPTFERLAEQAKVTCPVSRALAGTQITLVAELAPK